MCRAILTANKQMEAWGAHFEIIARAHLYHLQGRRFKKNGICTCTGGTVLSEGKRVCCHHDCKWQRLAAYAGAQAAIDVLVYINFDKLTDSCLQQFPEKVIQSANTVCPARKRPLAIFRQDLKPCMPLSFGSISGTVFCQRMGQWHINH